MYLRLCLTWLQSSPWLAGQESTVKTPRGWIKFQQMSVIAVIIAVILVENHSWSQPGTWKNHPKITVNILLRLGVKHGEVSGPSSLKVSSKCSPVFHVQRIAELCRAVSCP